MPSAENNRTYSFQRSIPIEGGYDLVVAGGGPAGSAAAICAARLGAKVLLLEATGCLGGMGTSALVSAWSDLADGERMIVGGIMAEVIEAMHARGHFKPGIDPAVWRTQLHGGLGFNAEGLKRLLDELCLDAGVELRFFTRVIDVDCDHAASSVNGVVINNIEGTRYIAARAFVDATGDAVLTHLTGAPCREAGRDTGHIMAPTLCSAQAGIDPSRFRPQDQQAAVFQAIADGFFSQNDRHVPGLFINGRTTAIMNAGHLFGTDALSCRSLSDGMIQGRQLADEYARFFRKYLPGCEEMEFVSTAALLGVRESRRIVGEYEINHADFTERRSFPDQICIYNKSVDIHVHDCSDEQWERYLAEYYQLDRTAIGEYYGLPYGILVPRGWKNLWVAGRCNSSDVKVHGAIRDQPACFMMGQAAGTAAVQSIKTGQPACDLDTASLVETLRRAGAYLPQPSLSRTMTRDGALRRNA
jgi:ribulose 1,5-bisphosphate synthetase/thiazole synthase